MLLFKKLGVPTMHQVLYWALGTQRYNAFTAWEKQWK